MTRISVRFVPFMFADTVALPASASTATDAATTSRMETMFAEMTSGMTDAACFEFLTDIVRWARDKERDLPLPVGELVQQNFSSSFVSTWAEYPKDEAVVLLHSGMSTG